MRGFQKPRIRGIKKEEEKGRRKMGLGIGIEEIV
jgi:hypothetical protein